MTPYGYSYGKQFWASNAWINNGETNGDWGAIETYDSIGNNTGWYGLQSYGSNSDLNNKEVIARGYPWTNYYTIFEQYDAPGHILSVYPNRLYIDVDVEAGQSGSPLCLQEKDGYIIGVVVGEDLTNNRRNVACRLTSGLIDTLKDIISN